MILDAIIFPFPLSDMGTINEAMHDEKWFCYELGQKKSVEEYMSFR